MPGQDAAVEEAEAALTVEENACSRFTLGVLLPPRSLWKQAMFGGNPIYFLIPPLVSVLAIMLLDQLRHAGRGWQYYVLAYLMVLAFQLVYMFTSSGKFVGA